MIRQPVSTWRADALAPRLGQCRPEGMGKILPFERREKGPDLDLLPPLHNGDALHARTG